MRSVAKSLHVFAFLLAIIFPTVAYCQDALPSWRDGRAKAAIVEFVKKVTARNGPDFVPIEDRIAVVDNDGTLWSEQPYYFQLGFILDRVKALASEHPEWEGKEPFKSILEGNLAGLASAGEQGIVELGTATHSGMTTDEFSKIVSDWFATAKHPRLKRPLQRDHLPADAGTSRLPAC
jgi:hypothetical protein